LYSNAENNSRIGRLKFLSFQNLRDDASFFFDA
jgi:hypothetical protein